MWLGPFRGKNAYKYLANNVFCRYTSESTQNMHCLNFLTTNRSIRTEQTKQFFLRSLGAEFSRNLRLHRFSAGAVQIPYSCPIRQLMTTKLRLL